IKINEKYYSKVQIALAGISAVLHGAQDGQKFMCVLAFCLFSAQTEKLPFPVVLWSSAFMALGTALCGKRMLRQIPLRLSSVIPMPGSFLKQKEMSKGSNPECVLPVWVPELRSIPIMQQSLSIWLYRSPIM
ncbi:MAG: inorganic phosphate transporter, partial [Lentisphaeria bacterium]|nr:inorganic phosphate transporter [Lentisphaeria bacterium]